MMWVVNLYDENLVRVTETGGVESESFRADMDVRRKRFHLPDNFLCVQRLDDERK